MLKQLEKLMPRNLLRNTCSGLFTSKLLYGIQLYSNVWGLNDMDDSTRRFKAFTKEDSRRLQVLQNKMLRILLKNPDRNTPTSELLNDSKELSVHQLGAFHTLQTVFKTAYKEEPKYMYERMKQRTPEENGPIFPHRMLNTIQVDYSMTLSRSGFIFRGSKLWNQLPVNLRSEKCPKVFKKLSKVWVQEQVPIKPP